MARFLLISFFIAGSLIGCGGGGGNPGLTSGTSGAKSGAPVVIVIGNWSGSFDGDDYGTCTATISGFGEFRGTCSGHKYPSFSINGLVNSQGQLSSVVDVLGNLNPTFNGQFLASGSGSGTWITKDNVKGTWRFTLTK